MLTPQCRISVNPWCLLTKDLGFVSGIVHGRGEICNTFLHTRIKTSVQPHHASAHCMSIDVLLLIELFRRTPPAELRVAPTKQLTRSFRRWGFLTYQDTARNMSLFKHLNTDELGHFSALQIRERLILKGSIFNLLFFEDFILFSSYIATSVLIFAQLAKDCISLIRHGSTRQVSLQNQVRLSSILYC